MPAIEQTAHIRAAPSAVFALISDVEGFSDYTDAVHRIERRGEDCYRWTVKVAGASLQWDVQVVECIPSERFAWRSVSGVDNRGCYTLTPVDGGTQVALHMEYHLANRFLERVVARAASSMIHKVGMQILERVRMRLETP